MRMGPHAGEVEEALHLSDLIAVKKFCSAEFRDMSPMEVDAQTNYAKRYLKAAMPSIVMLILFVLLASMDGAHILDSL